MVSIKWCLNTKNGIELVEPNDNMANSYLGMAEESINVLTNLQQSKIWTAVMTYYIFYYSLYACMLKIGIKCEIHACSLEFMKILLTEFYDKKDVDMINKASGARTDLQYYTDRPVDDKIIDETKKYCKDFFIKTKNIMAKINLNQINKIRKELASYS